MHPGALDVLHHARDDHGVAVADGVDLDFDAEQVLVHQHGAARHGADGPRHVALQLAPVAHDFHRAPTEHIRRTHEDRIADAIGDRDGAVDGCGRAADGLRDADVPQRLGESPPVLREVDRLDARAKDVDSFLGQRLRQVDGGLAAELHQRAGDALGRRDMERRVQVEWVEVQAVGSVEVGGHRFRVGVD